MESIQGQGGIGTPFLDGSDKCITHIATPRYDSVSLVLTQLIFKKTINGFACFTFSNPNDTGSLQVIDDGGVLSSFTIRDFINTDHFESSDLMSFPLPGDNPVQKVRHSRFGYFQQLGGRFLGHDRAMYQHCILKPVGHLSIGSSPGNILLNTTMNLAINLPRLISEKYLSPADCNITPDSWLI